LAYLKIEDRRKREKREERWGASNMEEERTRDDRDE
jgi:hypothetical protein